MMKKITFLTVVSFFFMGAISFAQGTITGTVTDGDLGGPLPGANVVEKGTSNGTVTDFDGKFSFKVSGNSGTITISYLGYTTKSISYTLSNGSADLGSVAIQPDADALAEVVIVGKGIIDLANERKTPVAVSTISAEEIQERVAGNVELAEAVKFTPSTYVSGQTGFGDSQFFLRGFDQTNIAILLNGQPVNGMEDGKVYWSNWAGIADIASTIQVQRGLGASKLAISSVGGTTNIVMRSADRQKGGFARFMGGNDSYFKATVSYDTGVNDKGWSFSVLLDHWQAHRKWARGTYGQGQNYYFAVGYKPNENHNFNFLVTGAPQLHGQRWSQPREIIAADPKFNQHWGYTEDGIQSERQNYYHKPVVNFNWDWSLSEKSTLGTVAYLSLGRGGGTGPRGNGRIRTEDPDGAGPLYGQIDYPAIEANNTLVGIGGDYGAPNGAGYIRRASVNNHIWYGMVSNFNHEISDKLSFNLGADIRFYTGDHFRQVIDFYGLSGWTNDSGVSLPSDYVVTTSYDANPWASLFDFAPENERIDYDNSETINYQGVFGQIEYASDKFTVFFQGAFSNQSYERVDRFFNMRSEKVNKTGYNIKGGMSYTIDEGYGNHKIFVNAGQYSRQPFSDDIFYRTDGRITELINPAVENQIITSFEGGYLLRLNNFRLNLNAYVTDWDNRTLSSFGISDNGTPDDDSDDFDISIFQRGVRQYHTGGEIDLHYKPSDWLTLRGFASGGSWVFKGTSDFATFNADTGALINEEEGIDRDGIKISSAPQTTWGLGFRANVVDELVIDANFKYYANHYLFTDETTTRAEYTGEQLGEYALTDAGLSYKMNLGSNDMIFRANVYNLFDRITIQQSDRFGFINTNGRTFNASIRYLF